MDDRTIIATVAILALMCLEVVAMLKGINGYLFGMVVALIAAIAGIEIRPYLERKKIIAPST